MSDEEFDPFHLTSGLPLSGATVTIDRVEFGYDAEYAANALVAMIWMIPDDGDAPDRPQLYSTGQGFEVTREGDLLHKSGKPTNFNDNSTYGKWIKAFTEMKGAEAGMAETRERETSPFSDKWMAGMRFKLGDLVYESFAGKGNPLKPKTLIVPVEYLGTVDGGKPAAKASGAAKKLAPKGGSGGRTVKEANDDDAGEKDGDNNFGIDDADTLKAIIKLAGKAADFDDFTDKAMDVDGVSDNRVWTKAVMSSKPDSLWATYGADS